MKKVVLHVYDVTNSASPKTNNTILHINKIFKDAIGLGGIFHSAVQVYGDEEWSFGFCETGSGVFSCPPTRNPMYTYRESIVLGETDLPNFSVNQILRELSREWPGTSYDLLSKNCNHFCDEFCEKVGVPKLPGTRMASSFKELNSSINFGLTHLHQPSTQVPLLHQTWVNRFANAGDAAMEVAGNTALRWRQAKTEIVTASKVAYRFLAGITSNSPVTPESASNSNRVTTPRFQSAWFKSIASFNARPSSSSEVPNLEEETHQYHQRLRPTEQWRCSSDGI